MAGRRNITLLLFSLFASGIAYVSAHESSKKNVSAYVFTLQNRCDYIVWPGTFTRRDSVAILEWGGGFALPPGATIKLPVPHGWFGHLWARTGCNFDYDGKGKCTTGDCGGLNCTGRGKPPVTLARFNLFASYMPIDFYDVSLEEGYNVGIGVRPSGRSSESGYCQYAGCVTDLNLKCPRQLQVVESGVVVGCESAWAAFNSPEYCSTGEYESHEGGQPTKYPSTFSCPESDFFTITFCPTSS